MPASRMITAMIYGLDILMMINNTHDFNGPVPE